MVAGIFLWSSLFGTAQNTPLDRTYAEAQGALSQGNYAEAERAYVELAKLDPGVPEIHANLGLIYFQERKFDLAIPELQHALKLKPGLGKTSVLLALSLSETGRYADALPGLQKGFRQSSDPGTRRMCGLQLERAYTETQRDSKAVEVALELARLYPSDPEVLYHNGKIFGNFAFLTMQKLAQVAPDSVWRHEAAGDAYKSQESFDSAISEYRRVLELDPRRPGIHYRLGRTLLARSQQTTSADDIAAAGKVFQQEIELDPTNANCAYEMAEIDRTAGKLEEAKEYFELALKNFPDFEQSHLGLAAVLATLGKPELALPHLQKAIQLTPGNEVSWYRLSQIEGRLGNSSEQQKALLEFQRLHAQKLAQNEPAKKLFSPDEVTSQQLDAGAVK